MSERGEKIKSLFSELETIDRIDCDLDYEDITGKIIELSEEIRDSETGEAIWWIGEGGAFTLADLIVGAYWHFTEYHDGQFSYSYRALSRLGEIFTPNISSVEEENQAYILLNEIAKKESTPTT